MVDVFARRLNLATRAVGMTDVLSPSQVRTFAECEVRWFYEHLLGISDPPSSCIAVEKAIRSALMTNFRHKLETNEDIAVEGVVGLFRRAWKKEQALAIFGDDENPQEIGRTGEELVRRYMQEAAPKIRPAVLDKRLHGVIGMVRIRAQLDVMDMDGTIIDIRTTHTASVDQMHRFVPATCSRLAEGASGQVRSDILVSGSRPGHAVQIWDVTAADIQWMDALYPLAQHAMQRGYYMPNRGSISCRRNQCPYWRRCEQDFGGMVAS